MGSIERLLLYYNEKDMLKNKESGEPDSRAEARLLQQPYFLGARAQRAGLFAFLCYELIHHNVVAETAAHDE